MHASAGRPSGLAWLSCVLPIGQSEWVTERGRFPEIPECLGRFASSSSLCSPFRRFTTSGTPTPSRGSTRDVNADSLGRYRIESKLGEGGMGVVWRAHDPQLGRDVALKVLPDALVADPEARARMLREARAVAALNHPNILGVYDVGEA